MVVAEGRERVDLRGLLRPLRGHYRALHRHGALAGGLELPRQVGFKVNRCHPHVIDLLKSSLRAFKGSFSPLFKP